MTWYWPMMGLLVGAGSVFFIAFTATMALRYLAPMASMANSWDTRLGGALADAVTWQREATCKEAVSTYRSPTIGDAGQG